MTDRSETATMRAQRLRRENVALGRANRRLREAISYTAIPTLAIFEAGNDGVRDAIRSLRRVVAESVR